MRAAPTGSSAGAALAATLVALLLVSACGGEEEADRAAEQRRPPDHATGADPRHVARQSGLAIPAGARELEATEQGAIDTLWTLRLTLPRERLEAFVEGSQLTGARTERRPFLDGEVSRLGWRPSAIERYRAYQDVRAGVTRRVIVDLDRPGEAVVYVLAFSS